MTALTFLLSPLGRWIAGAGALLAAVLALWLYVGHLKHDRDAARALAASEARAIEGLQAAAKRTAVTAKISDAAEAKQIVVQHDIQVQTRTIIKEVPTYVTAEADARCILPVGFVRLYNAAATGADPGAVPVPAGLADGAPSGLACSDVAADLADNFGNARANAEQLKALQGWVIDQAAIAR